MCARRIWFVGLARTNKPEVHIKFLLTCVLLVAREQAERLVKQRWTEVAFQFNNTITVNFLTR